LIAFEGKQFIIMVYTVLKRHYPDFNELLNNIPDHRQRRTYEMAEIIMAGLSIFIFKRGSRNNMDNFVTPQVEKNFTTLFGVRLPIMDTIHVFLKNLPTSELETLKQILVSRLIQKKVLDRYRYFSRFIVAIDGTGVFSFDYEPFTGCPHKTGKNGKQTWQVYVLEAKIVCSNQLSISIATTWLKNSDNIDEKQDCELKAFVRLAQKLKEMYPRLLITIAADSLYPNNTVFDICKTNGWNFITTFKEGNLKTVWEEVMLLYPLDMKKNMQKKLLPKDKVGWAEESAMFINGVEYQKHQLNWLEYIKAYSHKTGQRERFVHITDIKVDKNNVWDISLHGRLRWKIENEGFNTQKNGGYSLQHKFCRKHLGAMQNYYQLLQIAHLINQLTEKLQKVKEGLKMSGQTLISLWEDMISVLKKTAITKEDILFTFENTKQLRY
jgi:hypothetical protein